MTGERTRKTSETHKLDFVDALRGVAILMVAFLHCGNEVIFRSKISIGHAAILHKIFDQGNKGVQLFFVLSAFTLFYSYDKRKNEPGETGNFFIRRVFRIAPMYYLGITIYLFVNGTTGNMWSDYKPIAGLHVIANFLFIHGFNVYWFNSVVPGGWSIADEMVFYCLIPILVYIITSINRAFIYVVITVSIKVILELYFNNHIPIANRELWNNYIFWYLPSQLPVFGFGMAAYYLFKSQHKMKQFALWALLFIALAVIQLMLDISFIYLFYCYGFVALFMFLANGKGSCVVNKLTKFFGQISFSLYVLHFAIIHFIAKLFLQYFGSATTATTVFLQAILLYLITLVLGGFISSLTYRYVELSFQRLGQQLIAARKKQQYRP